MAAPPDIVKIGEISYRQKDRIGFGSHGTVVYRGSFGRRNVAVKKIPIEFAEIAEKEKDLLIRIDVHPNIVRYYQMEKDDDGCYIVLMLCDYTLDEFLNPEVDNLNLTPINLLKEITLGLQFLHESKIIHYDLKPLNVLISYPNHVNERKAMISDFGISKQTLGTRDSVTLTSRRGTDGFTAPEVYANNHTVTNAIDVFALGCIYFYVFSKGNQIFHSVKDVENVKKYKGCIQDFLETEQNSNFCSLVLRMIDQDAAQRPTCEQIISHHIFWTDEKKMHFLQLASDFMESNKQEKSMFDKISPEISGKNWIDQMSDNIVADLVNGKHNQGRKHAKEFLQGNARNKVTKYYDGTKTSSLIRAIRNIWNHYDDIVVFAKDELPSQQGFLHYCCQLFPKLLSKMYDTAEKWHSNKSIAKFYIQKQDQVGQFTFRLEPKIKITRNGSILYKGQYKAKTVAVKMYAVDLVSLGKNSWDLLDNIKHPTIVQLFHKEEKGNCLYIGSTLGQYNLFEYVQNYWNNDNPDPVKLLKQITYGLGFLHFRRIVHGDLTPGNILISYPNKMKKRRAMIADFESSHHIGEVLDISHVLKAKKLFKEWMSPEMQNSEKNCWNTASDVYSLGCIYMYVMSNGNQTFGKHTTTDSTLHMRNIAGSIMEADLGNCSGLLHHMLEYTPNLRPQIHKVLHYPIFWRTIRQPMFFKDVLYVITTNENAEHMLNTITEDTTNEKLLSRQESHEVHEMSNEKFNHDMIQRIKQWYDIKTLPSIVDVIKDIVSKGEDSEDEDSEDEDSEDEDSKYFAKHFHNIQELIFLAMEEFKEEPFLQKYYGVQLPEDNSAKCKWSNLNQRILHSIASKIPIKLYKLCILICKSWHENEWEFYTKWNRANWSKSSLHNAMERKVNCKEIYFKSSEEWSKNSAPTLIKEIDTGDRIRDISFSNDGTMLAVCHYDPYSLKIYDLKDFSVRFSRDFKELLWSSHFNSSDSCILVNTEYNTEVIANAVGLPTLHSTSYNLRVKRPWLQDNIFLTWRTDKETETFWLNKIPQNGDSNKRITESLIHRTKGRAYNPGIIQTGGRNILIYEILLTTKLAFKTIPENTFGEFPTKQNDGKIETQDREIDCKGEVKDYTLVQDGNAMEIYVLTERKRNDYCFMVIDLVNFEQKTSILLVPHDFHFGRHLASNSKCIISGNGEKHVCVWDLKSGACSNHLNEAHDEYHLCEIHPTNPELIITAGLLSKKFKLRHLNTLKYEPISQ